MNPVTAAAQTVTLQGASLGATLYSTNELGAVVLDGVDLSVPRGTILGYIGPNGAGKTTTIKILATLLKPTRGQAMIDGKTIGYENRLIRPIIGYVPDFMGAYEDMVVSEYLEFFAAAYDIHGSQRRQVVKDVLELTELTYKSNAEVNSLSRGMQQRLSVARVLLHDPKVLLMDEPASGLDPRARTELRAIVRELAAMGKTIIISSHILPELEELCTSVAIVDRGLLLPPDVARERSRDQDHRPVARRRATRTATAVVGRLQAESRGALGGFHPARAAAGERRTLLHRTRLRLTTCSACARPATAAASPPVQAGPTSPASARASPAVLAALWSSPQPARSSPSPRRLVWPDCSARRRSASTCSP